MFKETLPCLREDNVAYDIDEVLVKDDTDLDSDKLNIVMISLTPFPFPFI